MGNCQLGCFAGDFVRVSASCDVEQDSPGKSAAPDANSFNFIIILLVASLGRPVGAIQDILACSSKQPEKLFIIILLVASLGRPVTQLELFRTSPWHVAANSPRGCLS